jgi:hypothetical protein
MMFWQVVEKFTPGLEAMLDGKGDTVKITEDQVQSLRKALDWLSANGSEFLRSDISAELGRFPLKQFVGMTMNEALNYLNANVPPIPAPQPMPTPVVTSTPAPTSTDQCVAGYDPDCLAGPNLVPGMDGQLAYYVLNGVYFEYPSNWRVELWAGRTDILSLIPVEDSPEGLAVDNIPIFAEIGLIAPDAEYDPLTYSQIVWLRPTPVWNRLVVLPDFAGSEFLWANDEDTSYLYMEAIFYDPNSQTAIGALMPFKNDPPIKSVYDPDLVQKLYPNFEHILESLRFWQP